MSESYAPGLSLVGTAAAAPPTDLAELLRTDMRTVDGRILAALTLSSWSKVYAVPIDSLIDDDVARVVARMNKICIDDAGGGLEMLAAEEPLAKKFLNHDPRNLAPWRELMQQNSLTDISGSAPVFIAQGADDKIVRPSATNQFVEKLCHAGKSVTYDAVIGADHETVARFSAASAIAWIGGRFEGKPALSTCRLPRPRTTPHKMTKVILPSDIGNSNALGELGIVRYISFVPELKPC